jgi:hypothetical protein
MKRILLLFILFALTRQSPAQVTDSSALLFDETIVHAYNLTFYVEHWEDSLAYNYENGEEYLPARLEYNGLVFDSIGVRYKGNSSYVMSRGTPKKPLKFKFGEYLDEQTCYGIKKLNFSNCVKDPSFLREMLAYDIIRTYMPASRTAYATISVEGEQLGLYVQVEQVDKTFLKRHFADNDFNLYKTDDNGATMEYRGEDKESYRAEYELQTNEKTDDWSRMISMLQLLNTAPDESFNEDLDPWIDFTSAARLQAFYMVLSNFDSYTGSGRNFYLYDEELSGRFYMLPWDLNEAFGAYSNNWNVITQDIVSISNLGKRPLHRRILNNEYLRQLYLRFIRELLDGPAAYDAIAARADTYRALIDAYVLADKNKLYTYQNFLDNLQQSVVVGINMSIPGILPFTRDRNAQLRSQLGVYTAVENPPAIATEGIGTVSLWPNPNAGDAGIRYQLHSSGSVALVIRNMLGQEIRRVDFGSQLPGWYSHNTALTELQPGTYFYQLTLLRNDVGDMYSQVRKMLVLH